MTSFDGLFRTVPLALALTRRDNNTVLALNDYAVRMFGISSVNALGRPAEPYWVQPKDRSELRERCEASLSREFLVTEMLRDDGSRFWAEISMEPFPHQELACWLVAFRDITAEKVAHENLVQSQNTLQLLFQAAPVSLLLTGRDDGVIRRCNQRMASMLDGTIEQVIGRPTFSLYQVQNDRARLKAMLLAQGAVENHLVAMTSLAGRQFWARLDVKTLTVDGECMFMVGAQDITHQKELEERLLLLATTDSLTGVMNRRRLLEMAESELLRHQRYGGDFCVAVIDADRFKAINDRHGHAVGDDVLKLIVSISQQHLRATDALGRFGGEEFVVILPETGLGPASEVMDRVRKAIEAGRVDTSDGPVQVTVSIGVAQPQAGESLEAVIERADDALYRAKAAGRNRVMRSDSEPESMKSTTRFKRP